MARCGVPTVDDVSFDVPKGAFATLLGPSGSGKTTTLRMIAGFYDPDQGDIEIGGRPRQVACAPPWHRDGLPGLRALSAHDRARQRSVRAARRPRLGRGPQRHVKETLAGDAPKIIRSRVGLP